MTTRLKINTRQDSQSYLASVFTIYCLPLILFDFIFKLYEIFDTCPNSDFVRLHFVVVLLHYSKPFQLLKASAVCLFG